MKKNKQNAFTLIELLIVIALIGLITTVAVVNWAGTKATAKDTTRKAELKQISKALETYIDSNFNLPPGSGAICYRSDNVGEWDTLATLVNANLPVDPENAADYRYAFFRTDAVGQGCTPSPHCGWLMAKKQADNGIVILPVFKGDYTTAQAVATWLSSCGGGSYSGYEEMN